MPSTLVRDVLRRVSTLLQDMKPQYRRWSEIELVDALNDGQRALAKYLTLAGSRVDVIRLAPGSRQFVGSVSSANILPGDGSTPVTKRGIALMDVLRNMGASGATPGKVVRLARRSDKDAADPAWHAAAAATAIDEFMFDPRTPTFFWVSPPVHASTQVWVEIAWTAQPDLIPAGGAANSEIYKADGSNTQAITVDDLYVDDLVNYVVARAFLKDAEEGDSQNGQVYAGAFLASLNAQIAAQSGTNPNLRILPFAPVPIGSAK